MAHVLSREAAAELDQIWYHIAKESGSPDRADRLVDALTERFQLLSTYPRIGRERPDLRTGLRSFAVGTHVIIYRVDSSEDVVILHLVDGRRDLEAYF